MVEDEMKSKPVEIRDFSQTQVGEVNQYISAHVPYTILNQLFTLTENPVDKARVFTVVYRLIGSAKNYTSDMDALSKLQSLLKESEATYQKVYVSLHSLDQGTIGFNRGRKIRKVTAILQDAEANASINKLIDAFMVFVEKQVLLPVDQVMGIDLSNDEGVKIEKEIRQLVEKEGL